MIGWMEVLFVLVFAALLGFALEGWWKAEERAKEYKRQRRMWQDHYEQAFQRGVDSVIKVPTSDPLKPRTYPESLYEAVRRYGYVADPSSISGYGYANGREYVSEWVGGVKVNRKAKNPN